MGEIINNFFNPQGITLWKLYTPQDYLFIGLLIVLGAAALWLATRHLAKQRTPEGTTARMAKKLRKLGGRGAQVWRDVTVVSQRGRCVCPMLYAAREGVYVVQVYHFGLDVSGSASSKYWTLSFNKDVRQVDNPLDAMDEQIVVVNRVLAKAGLGHVPVEKLVNAAVELDADVIMASTIISHDDIHYKNIANIDRLAREMGVRDRVIFIAGGTQITPELAVENGADAGFGRGSKGIHDATFMVKRRRELEAAGKWPR